MIPFIIHIAMGAAARAAAAQWLIPLIFSTMVRMVPIGNVIDPGETVADRAVRWHAIAAAIAEAATTPRGHEQIVEPTEQRRRVAVLLAIGKHETGYRRDADVGPCKSAAGNCDGGRSVSPWQVMTHSAAEKRALQGNRAAAANRALGIALTSEGACHGDDRYRTYASGSCDGGGEAGAVASRELVASVAHAQQAFAVVAEYIEHPYGR